MKKLLLILLCLPFIVFGQDIGCISGDCNNGYGTYHYHALFVGEEDEGVYVGEWKNQKHHGQGTYTYQRSQNKYVGEWKNDKRDGEGTFFYYLHYLHGKYFKDSPVGSYIGEWKNDKRHGKGTYTYVDSNQVQNWRMIIEDYDINFDSISKLNRIVQKGLWENDEFLGE